MRSPRSRRAGFTLLEIMAVMTVLALVLGLLIVSLTSLLRLEQADSAFYDRVMNNDRVADRFRTDVAQATSAPTEWSTYQAGTHCLILEQPNGMHVVLSMGHRQQQAGPLAGAGGRSQQAARAAAGRCRKRGVASAQCEPVHVAHSRSRRTADRCPHNDQRVRRGPGR